MVACLGIPSEISISDRMQLMHILDGLGAMTVPQEAQRLKDENE
jgi:hypothetical protein